MALKVGGTTVVDDSRQLTNVTGIDATTKTTLETALTNVNANTLDGQDGSYYTGYTDTAIANLVASAPTTLDTLNELAAALGDDPNFATTVTNSIATKAASSITISAGGGLTGGGNLTANRTISHADTSAQSSVNNSNGVVIQDVTLDGYGHVTALGSIDLDGRYYTESEADSRFVNVTGDTMTGNLTIDTNTGTLLTLQATNGSPWALDLGRDDVTNSKVFNGGGYWSFEHEPRFYNAGSPQKLFHDGYHPNADKLTTARNIALTGAVTGNANFDGSGNISITTTATADPTLTINGDASGSATFTNLGNATLTLTIADDSHNHNRVSIYDNRAAGDVTPDNLPDKTAYFTFTDDLPSTGNTWDSVINMAGWGNGYRVWQLASNSGNGDGNTGLYFRSGEDATWGPMERVFTTEYHPNADKWTTARTITLGGDLSGSVSIDGSANVTLTATVANDSHSHSNYLLNTTDTLNGILTINTTSDYQLHLTSTNTWAGILFNDSGPVNDYIWYNGGAGTFAIGGGGSNVSGKKLHVDGGMSVGANADSTSTPTNGIYSEGAISVGGSIVWHSGNDGSGSGLDADTVDGYHRTELVPYQSSSDFADGTLVTTSINSSVSSGDSFVIEVTGKAYGSSFPHHIIAEGYIYNNTIINTNGVNIAGSNFTYLKVMNNNGYLSFWWPRHGYWNSYSVTVRSSSQGTASGNRVTSIVNSVDPSAATKKIQINLVKSWNSGNDGSSSGLDADLLDGQHGSYYYSPANAPDPTLTINGDASGSATFTNLGNATLTLTIADDSHNHVISNIDGLQTALDGKLSTSGKAADSNLLDGQDSTAFFRANTSNAVDARLAAGNGRGVRFWDSDNYKIWMSASSDATWGGRLDSTSDYNMYFRMSGGTNRGFVFQNSTTEVFQVESTGQTRQTGNAYVNTNQRVFADNYHPNADKWTTARTLTIAGDATGSASIDGSANVTLTVDVGNANTVDGYNAPQIYNGTHSYIGGYYVNGVTGQKPNNSILGAGKMRLTMQSNSNLGFGGSWNDVLWMSSYTGSDVKLSTALVSSKYDNTSLWIAKQNYDSASWGTGYLIWNSGNDGSGSGLDADLLDGLHLHTGRNNEANKVVRTDGSGYIQAGWINTTSGATTGTLDRIYASYDGYIRYVTPATFRSQITDGHYYSPANPPPAGGATGGGSDQIFWENDQVVTTSYTITNGKNAGSFGPITINSGVTVTVGDGETWTVV